MKTKIPVVPVGSTAGSASEDIFNSEEYAKFVESMVPHCHCRSQDRPCDGVLAGGLCDNIQDETPELDELRPYGSDETSGEFPIPHPTAYENP
jgi:hypothetical protein